MAEVTRRSFFAAVCAVVALPVAAFRRRKALPQSQVSPWYDIAGAEPADRAFLSFKGRVVDSGEDFKLHTALVSITPKGMFALGPCCNGKCGLNGKVVDALVRAS